MLLFARACRVSAHRGCITLNCGALSHQLEVAMNKASDIRQVFSQITGDTAMYYTVQLDGKGHPIFDEVYVRMLEQLVFHEIHTETIENNMKKYFRK